MATRAQKIKVGIFLLVGLAMGVAVFLVIALQKRTPRQTYYVRFTESVSGLGSDSPVRYQGFQVGRVENISVNDQNEIIVKIGIDKGTIDLRKGTEATLEMTNLMGKMGIELSGGGTGGVPLPPGSYIPAKSSILENIAQDLPRILDNIKSILDKINQSIGEKNTSRINSLIDNADRTMIQLQETAQTLKNSAIIFNRTSRQFGNDPSSIIWGRSSPDNPYVY